MWSTGDGCCDTGNRPSLPETRFVLSAIRCGIFRDGFLIEQIAHKIHESEDTTMAKRNRYVRFTLTNGDTKVVQTKTCTERYIRNLIEDLRIAVVKWEVL